ncbi:deoxyribose-phosphate aldolase [Tengunoibacter tsumagoiensis]|uniref:Deoxyribose-phosphate aldolase n=1 Tax=Tengunoibacter tsumagoiensis TaxID=2014871 RepID=A0A402A668_9CHLR|nr:deoxyribose-phosphate aldolase [Tengunoibacter tsumagoiensis]GCE14634.1 deoxyribose-phosphate aldolase [Tengunoibacter tsumagoiensis]
MSQIQINRYLDHAILRPEMSNAEVVQAIKLGIEYKVKTVCVRPCDIELALQLSSGTETAVCCVLGFPHGVVPGSIKAEEAKLYVALGVAEIDMVVNYSYIKSGAWDKVEQDIQAVYTVTHAAGVTLKVILETSMLTLDEIKQATIIARGVGTDFVKTSTGFNGPGATEEAVKAMLEAAQGEIKVKPSGGIRDAEKALKFIQMGCHRLGVNYTSTVAICEGLQLHNNTNSQEY